MSGLERVARSDDDWATAPTPEGPAAPVADASAWIASVAAAGDLSEAVRALDKHLPAGIADRLQRLAGADVVALVALLQGLRAEIARLEAWAVREVGKDEAVPAQGVLPDGRPYSVLRGATRKAWEHDDWQRDVRQQVLSGVSPTLVDPDTGESVQVADLLAAVQKVHGSTAPRATALKALGLRPDDYCESFPGPWSLKIENTTPNPVQEN